jgi:Uma2 family endonuclease
MLDPAPAQPLRMTVAEFLAWDSPGDTRYELVGGEPVMMAPPKVQHVDIADNVTGFIRPRLRPPCRVSQGVGVLLDRETDDYFEADLAVSCEPRRAGQQHLEAPRLVVEFLSPSTRHHDLGTKLDRYRELPSVEEVLLVSSTGRRVTHWLREGDHWRVQDVIGRGFVTLALVEGPLDLDVIYADVALEPADGGS